MAGLLSLIETEDANATKVQVNYRNLNPVAGAVAPADVPVTKIEILNDGRAVAGIYTLTFTNVTPAGTATCKIDCTDSNSPYRNVTGVTVALNDPQASTGTGTKHIDIVGGVGLWFSNSSNFTSSWSAQIIVGGYFNASGAATATTAFGILTAGTTTTPKKVGVKNFGDQNCESSVLGIYPGVYFKNTTSTPVHKIRVNSKTVTPGKYIITLDKNSYNGGASPHTINAYVAQYSYDTATAQFSTLVQASTFKQIVNCDDVTEHVSVISGMYIYFSTSISNADQVANVYVEAPTGVQVATDVAGVPGAWTAANDIVLTEVGGTTGRIQPNNTAYFWVKVVTSSNDTPGNLRKFILRPSAVSIGGLAE